MAGRQGEGDETPEGMSADDHRRLDVERVEAPCDGIGMVLSGVAGGRSLRAPEAHQVGNDEPSRLGG